MATVRDEPLSVSANHALVLSDIHAPFHSKLWLERAVRLAKTFGGSRIAILAGDTWDFSSLSNHAPHTDPPTLETERNSGRAVVRALASVFDKVYVTLGNHEFRAVKKLKEMTPKLLMEFLVDGLPDNVVASPYWYSWLNDKKWFLCHPQKYSTSPLKVAASVADNLMREHGRPINVLTGHEHHAGTARVGAATLVSNPCLQDPKRTPYIYYHELSTGFPGWQMGFTHIEGSKVEVFHEGSIQYLNSLLD